MNPSKKAKQMLSSLRFYQIKKLAHKQSNLPLFLELHETEDYEELSRKLGVYHNYLAYHKKVSNLLELNAIENSAEIAQLLSDYYTFLLEKICFPS